MWMRSIAFVIVLGLGSVFLSAQSPAAGGNAPASSSPGAAAAGSRATLPTSGPDEIAQFGPYGEMVVALGLSAAQKEQILERYAQQHQAQAKYLQEAQRARATAMEQANSSDAETARKAKLTIQGLQKMFDAVTAEGHARIMGVLTKEQALTWEEKTLCDRVVAQVMPVQVGHGAGGEMTATRTPLTAEQMKIVRAQCARTAKEIHGWPNPYDPVKREPAVAALVKTVRQELAKLVIPAPAAHDQ